MELLIEDMLPSVVKCKYELVLKLRVDAKILETEAEVDVDSTAPELTASNIIGMNPTGKELIGVRAEDMLELTNLDQKTFSSAGSLN